jgi:VWFA-related protein
VTNQAFADRRLIVIYMDDAMMPHDVQMVRSAKEIANDVIERLGPGDLAAVVFSRDNRAAQNFTSDRSRLRLAVESFASSGFEPPVDEARLYAPEPLYRESASTLFRTVETLAQVTDRRKALLYIGTGIPMPTRAPATSDWPVVRWLVQRALTLAQRASVNIYAVDPAGLDGMRALLMRRQSRKEPWLIEQLEQMPGLYSDFLRATAENTGGRAFLNTNEFSSRVEQIFEDTGEYYLLGYIPTNTSADGRFRRIEVRVNRRNATVSARRGYYADAPSNPAIERQIAPAAGAIAQLLPRAGLPLSMHVAAFTVTPEQAAVIVTLGIEGTEASKASLELAAFSPEGAHHSTIRAQVAIAAGTNLAEGVFRFDLPPGRFELRAGVSDSAGVAGSVYGFADVPDPRHRALHVSEVMVVPDDQRSIAMSGPARAVLPAAPTTRRSFLRSDRISTLVRVTRPAGSAGPVTVTRTIEDSEGRVVSVATARVGSGEPDSAAYLDSSAALPLDGLTAGAYLLRVAVTDGADTATRALRFSVR